MSHDACILPTRTLAVVKTTMNLHPRGPNSIGSILRRKLDAAHAVSDDDVPADVATLGSRLLSNVDEGNPNTRVISDSQKSPSSRFCLPITALRGPTLLSLREGQKSSYSGHGLGEAVLLEGTLYQPEVARREALALGQDVSLPKTGLRLVSQNAPFRSPIVGTIGMRSHGSGGSPAV